MVIGDPCGERFLLEVGVVREHGHDLAVELVPAPAPQQVEQAVIVARDEDRGAIEQDRGDSSDDAGLVGAADGQARGVLRPILAWRLAARASLRLWLIWSGHAVRPGYFLAGVELPGAVEVLCGMTPLYPPLP